MGQYSQYATFLPVIDEDLVAPGIRKVRFSFLSAVRVCFAWQPPEVSPRRFQVFTTQLLAPLSVGRYFFLMGITFCISYRRLERRALKSLLRHSRGTTQSASLQRIQMPCMHPHPRV